MSDIPETNNSDNSEAEKKQERELTDAEKARKERNRQKALHIRQAKLVAHPYTKTTDSIIKVQGTKFVDSGGGFLIEESAIKTLDDKGTSSSASNSQASQPSSSTKSSTKKKKVIDEALAIPVTYEECLECGDKFIDSYLFKHFDYSVCDKCRDPQDKHKLMTRTRAKEDYLLKDCDLDLREPPLKYISRKNPHYRSASEMRLYLILQVEKRALEVWGSEEEIERQREERVEKRTATKIKKYNQKLKQLRMDMRSSLYDRTNRANHTHEFGRETYNAEDDTYTHSCLTCPYAETFEKL